MASNTPTTKDEDLSVQVERLRDDLKGIAATVAKLAEQRVDKTRSAAENEVANIVRSGQHVVDDLEDEFAQMGKQVKTSIRQKPVTAVLGAIAVGYLLARLTR